MKVAVIGLGYVGLPLALRFAESGAAVLGLDLDGAKRQALREGRSYIKHIPAAAVKAAVASGKLRATADFAQVAGADAMLICVPTPLKAGRAAIPQPPQPVFFAGR